jgi:hypothetical protein
MGPGSGGASLYRKNSPENIPMVLTEPVIFCNAYNLRRDCDCFLPIRLASPDILAAHVDVLSGSV